MQFAIWGRLQQESTKECKAMKYGGFRVMHQLSQDELSATAEPGFGDPLIHQFRRPPVLFVHGLCFGPNLWDGWSVRFESAGHNCVAPAWPGREKNLAELRANPPDEIAALTFDEVLGRFVGIAEAMTERPIVVGHSVGGLIARLLIEMGLGIAGVAIDSPPPPELWAIQDPFLLGNWALLHPLAALSLPYVMPFPAFQYLFAHDLSRSHQQEAYDLYVSPESLRVALDARLEYARVGFEGERSPLLLIAGGTDHQMSRHFSSAIAPHRLSNSSSVVDYQCFGNRSHLGLLIGRDWELVADAVVAWADRRTREERAQRLSALSKSHGA